MSQSFRGTWMCRHFRWLQAIENEENRKSHFRFSWSEKSRMDLFRPLFSVQSDFRDRTSSLETVFSSLQGVADARAIVFYEKEYLHQYQRLLSQFEVFASLAYPIDETALEQALKAALQPAG